MSVVVECLQELRLFFHLVCQYFTHQIANPHDFGIGNSIDCFTILALRGHNAARTQDCQMLRDGGLRQVR